MPPGGPGGEHLVEPLGEMDLGHRQTLALLARGDRQRAQPVLIEALGLGARGPYRQKRAGAELGRLFDEPIEPGPLDRREQEPEVGLRLGCAQLPLNREANPIFAGLADPAQKFALGRVERRHPGVGAKPQNVAQPVRLRRIEFDLTAGSKPIRNVETGCQAIGQIGLLQMKRIMPPSAPECFKKPPPPTLPRKRGGSCRRLPY